MTPEILGQVLAALKMRRTCLVATRLSDGTQTFIATFDSDGAMNAAARRVIEAGRSQRTEIDGEAWFLHLHAPPPRLIVVGAVHIAQSLAALTATIGGDVVVCDPRGHYATAERFPGIRLRQDWPDDAVRAEQPGRADAVVALSHDPKLDDPALTAALETPCGYIGALGSRRSHAARLERLRAHGINDAALTRILGPVGLDIGAVGADEIGVSILAEWIARRRGAALRDRGGAALSSDR